MKEFNKPDVKASRYRPKVNTILDKEFFENFKQAHPKYKDLDNKLIRKMIKRFNQVLYQTVIDTRDGVQLPEQLGWIFIGTCQKSKKKNIDYGKSQKYGVSVSNKNWETDGNVAKIFYSSYSEKYHYKNRECWNFVACRNFKRAVSEEYPKKWTMYHEVDPHKKINEQFLKTSRKQFAIKKTELDSKNYKDFEI